MIGGEHIKLYLTVQSNMIIHFNVLVVHIIYIYILHLLVKG